jgi:hypothetical protein
VNISINNGAKDDQTMKAGHQTISTAMPCKIGRTTYMIREYFKPTARESLMDKLVKLALSDEGYP